jgi:hypothetical protein
MNSRLGPARPLGFPLRWLVVACLALACGCDGGRGELMGKVIYKEKPVRMGWVLVSGNDGLVRSVAIEDDGSYHVKEVPAGPVKLSVTSPDPSAPRPPSRKKGPDAPKPPTQEEIDKWVALPDKYGDFTQSELTFTVQRGTNTFDIDLK